MIKMNQIDNLLERVNNNLALYYSNIQKIAVCKGQKGYAIEVVVDGNQIDSYYKNLTKKQLYTGLEILYRIIGDRAVVTSLLGDEAKNDNGSFIKHLIKTLNEQNLD
ncbi:hypothetical protein [Methanobrevibacter sp.]|uniref:hypothetical protein n=1 Tax=Methanobrevibacter sp. TaxID=66852 RepID=UPI003867A87A